MYINMRWSNANEYTKCITTCVANASNTSEDTKCLSECHDQTLALPAVTQNASHVLSKRIQCQWGITKRVSECVDQTSAMPARTQNASQYVLSKHIPRKGSTQNLSEHAFIKSLLCQRGHKMHPNMCWLNPSHASKDWKYILTCVQKIRPTKSMTQNAFQHVLTKTLSCQQGHKIHLNMFWPKLFLC